MAIATIFVLGLAVATVMAQCPSQYASLFGGQHTMCLTDRGVDIPLSAADKVAIVNRHNQIRSEVEPNAGQMQEMVWDDNLAAVARKWALQCQQKHDEYGARAEPALPGVPIGQNIGWGYSDVLHAIDGWEAEKYDFSYGLYDDTAVVGHYTQVVFEATTRVGCGMADCSGVAGYPPDLGVREQVCNYGPGQSGKKEIVFSKPWSMSDYSCADCPNNCDSDSVCDCGGKVCTNGGKLNVATCTCDCGTYYTGDTCQNKNCPAKDDALWCNYFLKNPSALKGIPLCGYTNLKYEKCPYYCKFCP